MQLVLQPVLYYIRLYITNLVSAHCSLFNTSFRISLSIHLYSADNKYKWYECIVIQFVVINLNTFTKKIFSIYFTNTVSHLKGGEAKKNQFFGQQCFNTNTLNTCEFYVWHIYFEWCLVASNQIPHTCQERTEADMNMRSEVEKKF